MHPRDARAFYFLYADITKVNDVEPGLEWQVVSALELPAIHHRTNRTNFVTGNRAGWLDYQDFDADALRFQLQYNYGWTDGRRTGIRGLPPAAPLLPSPLEALCPDR